MESVVNDVFELIAILIPVLILAWLASRLLGIRRSALRSFVTGRQDQQFVGYCPGLVKLLRLICLIGFLAVSGDELFFV